jgi:hypothetical protein
LTPKEKILMTASLLRFELQNAGVSAATVEAEVMIGIFTIEGLLMHDHHESATRHLR